MVILHPFFFLTPGVIQTLALFKPWRYSNPGVIQTMMLQPQIAIFLLAPDPTPPPPGPLQPFDILRLVGFATGAALHLYLCLMIYRRYGIRSAEGAVLALGLSAGLWHLGNFAAAISLTLLGAGRALWWLKASNVVAYTALAFM